VHCAIEVARRAGRPLVIMVKMREPLELQFFEDVVKPLVISQDIGDGSVSGHR
jgi:hypothetical protein